METIKPGVYRHYKLGPDGQPEYYLLLWTGHNIGDVKSINDPMFVYVHVDPHTFEPTFTTRPESLSSPVSKPIAIARAHGPIENEARVAIYVPLYKHKPGRRVQVRPLAEFTERVAGVGVETTVRTKMPDGAFVEQRAVCTHGPDVFRFTYVGDTIPQCTDGCVGTCVCGIGR